MGRGKANKELAPKNTVSLDNRPDFGPKQIRSKDEIEVGAEYVRMRTSSHLRFQVTGKPHQMPFGDGQEWVIPIRYVDTGVASKLFLGDVCVEPYQTGRWNTSGHIERLD